MIANFQAPTAKNALVSLETVYRDMNDINNYVQYANSLRVGASPHKRDSLNCLAAESVCAEGRCQGGHDPYLQSLPNGAYSSDASYLGLIADEQVTPTSHGPFVRW